MGGMGLTDDLLEMMREALARVDTALADGDGEGAFRAAIDVAGFARRLDDHLSNGQPHPAEWTFAGDS